MLYYYIYLIHFDGLLDVFFKIFFVGGHKMTKLKMFLMVMCFAVGFTAFSNSAANTDEIRPEWVEVQLQELGHYSNGPSWARFLAWGEGTMEEGENTFFWFMWSNTDGYIQMNISVEMTGKECSSVELLEDVIGRPFECASTEDFGTWIGTSNDFLFCKSDLIEKLVMSFMSDGILLTRYTLERLLHLLPFTFENFEIREYLK